MPRSRPLRLWVSALLLAAAVRASLPLTAQGAAPAAPAGVTFTVNNNFDVAANFSNDPGFTICHTTPNNNICTLRAAIMNANRHAGGGATINLPAGTHVLSLTPVGLDDDTSGDLNITQTVTIVGAGAAGTIVDGAQIDRVFQIDKGVMVTMSGITIRNGAAADYGGGLRNAGNLTVNRSTVSGNRAGLGGGIFNDVSATLMRRNDTISANIANINDGGGIFNYGSLTLNNSR